MSNIYINGLAQDCGNSIANALGVPQSRIKPLIWDILVMFYGI